MPRPRCRRRVGFSPDCCFFKPAGVPMRELQEVLLTPGELEALRLADAEGMYQEAAAESMGISRPTFSRTVEAARKKVADALVNGKAIRIETAEARNDVEMIDMRGRGMGRGRGLGGRGQGRGRGYGRGCED